MAFDIQGPAGRLEALLDDPAWECHIGPVRGEDATLVNRDADLDASPRVAVVLAHPLPPGGGTMHNKVVYQIAKGFCRTGAAVLRFNFRGVGTSEGAFEDGPGEMADYRAALDFMASRYPGVELWAAGFSFGAWVALTVGAMDDRVTTLIGVAPPVDHYDFSAVLESLKPKFFIQGDRDDLCPYQSMREFYARVPDPKELVTIDGGDHLFDGKTSEVAEAVEELLLGFSASGIRESRFGG
jgi:alpha/beta superfamily hydrolase